jgi:hypothetical protein
MSALAKGNPFQFNLGAPDELLPVAKCVATVSKHGLIAAGDDCLARSPPVEAAATA